MTSRSMNINPRSTWPSWLLATVVALGLAALVVPAVSSASNKKVDGVRARVKRGTLEVKGTPGADALALRLKAGDPDTVEVDVGNDRSPDFSFARRDLRAIAVEARGGADFVRVDDTNGGFTDSIPTTIDGGAGDDTLNGGLGIETLIGGEGDDTVDGGRGDDIASLGGGNDVFVWDPGEGNDVIEGQDGIDTMVFNGAAVDETATLTANRGRLTFFRTPGNVTMDTDDVEIVDFNALGGKDSVTVNDLSSTDVALTNVDLAGALGGDAGDRADDNVVVNGTDGDDTIDVDRSASGADVIGLANVVSVSHTDPTDTLSVNTLLGTDNAFVTGVAGGLRVFLDGTLA